MRGVVVRRAVAVAVVLALPGCTTGVRRADPSPSTAAPSVSSAGPSGPSVSASASGAAAACPASYAPPDPKRPKIRLTFDLSDDRRVVTGTEHVEFTPDQPVTELVFRAWPNSDLTADNKGRLEVTSASLPMTVESAGAAKDAPGTLIRLALPARVEAGTKVTADLSFRLTLPDAAIDRYGRSSTVSWWGSGHPLLAWQRGRGWATEHAEGILGETASNEAADYDVTVTAPAGLTVVASGHGTHVEEGGRWRWRFKNPVARDFAVVAGGLVSHTLNIQGVPTVIAIDEKLDPARTLGPVRANIEASLRDFTARFGPYPYPTLTAVALSPIASAGVEYPGLIFVGSRRYGVVVTHEMAHEWFYGLVGNNQATDPWLDEAFATYGEALVNEVAEDYLDGIDIQGPVGAPMSYWDEHEKAYGSVVYSKGAAALLLARERGPAAAFDKAVRCYVNRHAYGIATVADLEAALAHLPRSLEVLREAEALP